MKILVSLLMLNVVACAIEDDPVIPLSRHQTDIDFANIQVDPRTSQGALISNEFNPNNIFKNEFYQNDYFKDYISPSDIDFFLRGGEIDTYRLYGSSWLAFVDNSSEAIIAQAEKLGVNPILLLAVEQAYHETISIYPEDKIRSQLSFYLQNVCTKDLACINRHQNKSTLDMILDLYMDVDTAEIKYEGFTLISLFQESKELSENYLLSQGIFKTGDFDIWNDYRPYDDKDLIPENEITMAMYITLPWVGERDGGCWLIWNIALLLTRHFEYWGLLSDVVDN
jgi:hypothetical protein